MKKAYKFTFLAIFATAAIVWQSACVHAQDVKFTSYYPTPQGKFSKLHLSPRTLGVAGGSCTLGSIYMDKTEHLPFLCADDGTENGVWGPLTNPVWSIRSVSRDLNGDTVEHSVLELQPVSTEVPPDPLWADTIISLGDLDPENNPPEFGIHLYENAGFLFTGYLNSVPPQANDLDFTLPPPGLGSHFIWHPKKGALRIGVLSNYPQSIEDSLIADCKNTCESEKTDCDNACSGDATCLANCEAVEQTCKDDCDNIDVERIDFVDFSDGTGYWDENNIGKYSVAIGHNQLARGNYSSALGRSSAIAYGPYSTVIGSGTTGQEDGSATCTNDPSTSAPGCYSTAFFSTIIGYASAGKGTIDGDYSFFGMGAKGEILSDYSASLSGYYPTVCQKSNYSAVFSGAMNTINPAATTGSSSAYCLSTLPDTESYHSIIASGYGNKIKSNNNTVFSGKTNIIETKTHSAIIAGNSNLIEGSGQASVILSGSGNTISGNYSTIVNGSNNTIERDYSTILAGDNNTIRQSPSASSTTGGEYSTIINGNNNFVESTHSVLFGRNVHLTENADRTFAFAFNDGTCTYSAGSYSSDCLNIDTNDAFILHANDGNSDGVGDMKLGINNTNPLYPLHVNAGNTAGGSGTFIDINGNLYVKGYLVTPSDRRLKKNITDISNPLDRLMALSPKTFLWKQETHNHPDGPTLGFIAQEIQPLFPQWVKKGSDNYLTFNPNGIEGLITESIREFYNNDIPSQANIKTRLKNVASLLTEAQDNKRIIEEKRALIKTQEEQISALKGN